MSTFTDDFSSGSLAGYTGVVDISPTPTGGPAGAPGIIATGTASQQYYGELEKVFPTSKRHGRAAFTFDCAAAGYSTSGNYNIDIRTASAGSTILYCTQSGTDPYALDIYNTFPPGGSATPALTIGNILPGGTFTRVELRFQLSTEVLGALSFDGWWRVLVDGVGMGGETNVQIGVLGHGWGAVGFSPMGAGSDVLISDDDLSLLTTVLPGPLSGDVSFIVNLESDSPYPYGTGNPTFVCSGLGHTDGSTATTVTTDLIVAATTNPTVAMCGSRAGGWWQATDVSAPNVVPVVIGVPGADVPLGVFTVAGALTETITLPQATFDQGAVAISGIDDRIYAIATDPVLGCDLLVYDSAGTLLATTAIIELGSHVYSYSVAVPSAGKVWVAVEGATTGLIWEYDTSGVFQGVIAALTCADGGYIQAAYGMVKIGSFVYFNTLRGTGFEAVAGVYKYDLIGGGNAVQIIAADESTTRIQALSVSAAGDLLMARTASGTQDTVLRYSTAGALLHTYAIGGSPYIIGLAGDPTDNVAWAGDDSHSEIVRLDLGTGATTTFSSVAGGSSCASALAAGRIAGTGATQLLKYRADGTVDRTVDCAVLLCNGPMGLLATRSLMELPSGNLLSIVRSTGVLTEVDGTTGAVVTSYGLTITSQNGLDAAVDAAGTRLVFLDVTASGGPTDVRVWNLTDDTDAGTLFTDDAQNAWSLVWLADCSIVFMVFTGVSMTPARRYSMDGTLLGTYAYDETTFPSAEEVYGLAASVDSNRLWMIRDWDSGMSSEQPAVLVFNLSTTGPMIQIPLVGQLTDYDNIACIADPYVGIMCNPFPPTPTTSTFPVRRLRRLKLAYDKNLLLTVDRIELKMQVGEGTVDVPNPQVMLRASKDGGRTWGALRMCSGGRMGEYSQRVYWNRWGQGRDWVLEFTVSDPVPWNLLEVIADVTEGTS